MAEYLERQMVIEAIKSFGKNAIDKGKQQLDTVDDIIALVNVIESMPCAAKAKAFDKHQLELIYKALRHYSAYGKEEDVLEQIENICILMNDIEEEN